MSKQVNESPEAFLDKNVKVVIEPMIVDILEEKPEEPVILNLIKILFMIEWLKKFSGINTAGNMEKEELKNLRKEMAKLKKLYAVNDNEEDVGSDESVINIK